MNNLFFSIIIPIHNTLLEYMNDCIEHLVNQTFKHIEIIVVDDGSNTATAMHCDQFAERDSRIKVIHQKNQGVSNARNNGILAARGRWILFVDADDWLELDACEKLYSYLLGKDYDMLLFRSLREKQNGVSTIIDYDIAFDYTYDMSNLRERELFYRKAMQPANIVKNSVAKDTFYYIWNKVFNRKFLLENSLCFPTGIPNSEDKVFILNCLMRAHMIHSVPDVLHHYRIIASSATRKYSETSDIDRIKLLALLENIAINMDKQLSELSGKANAHVIEGDYRLFTYMIGSNILLRKFYHPQYPLKGRKRKKNAVAVLCCEPFKSAIETLRMEELKGKEIVRWFLLRHRLYYLFSVLCGYISK